MKNKHLEKIRKRIKPENKRFIVKSFDISDRIVMLMQEQGINQKELAKKMGKSPSQISSWLSGTHNFTLKTITDLEVVFGETILETPVKKEKEVIFWKGLFKELQGKVKEHYANV